MRAYDAVGIGGGGGAEGSSGAAGGIDGAGGGARGVPEEGVAASRSTGMPQVLQKRASSESWLPHSLQNIRYPFSKERAPGRRRG